jgi:hypothetical protein
MPGSLPRKVWDAPWMKSLDCVVLVHRLREVVAQVGFTRFEAATADVAGELDTGVEMAALARELSWLPAVENRGEGMFLSFRVEAIREWLTRPAVQRRDQELLAGFEGWKKEHPLSKREFPGLAYIMLHSLSHLLIAAVSLECGYPASSIRERVYATDDGYGILLYTGTPTPRARSAGWWKPDGRSHGTCEREWNLAGCAPTTRFAPSTRPRTRWKLVPGGCGLSRLSADRGDVVRTVQRLPRPRLVVLTVEDDEAAFFQV